MAITRSEILANLRAKIARNEPIIGGGAGTGISAKCEEAGGIDLIVIYNSGRYRMAGRGSLAGLLAYGNAISYWNWPAKFSLSLKRYPFWLESTVPILL